MALACIYRFGTSSSRFWVHVCVCVCVSECIRLRFVFIWLRFSFFRNREKKSACGTCLVLCKSKIFSIIIWYVFFISWYLLCSRFFFWFGLVCFVCLFVPPSSLLCLCFFPIILLPFFLSFLRYFYPFVCPHFKSVLPHVKKKLHHLISIFHISLCVVCMLMDVECRMSYL